MRDGVAASRRALDMISAYPISSGWRQGWRRGWRGRDERSDPGLSEFFAMGGYAAYVWPSYGVAFGVMAALLAWAWSTARRGEAEVERLRASGLDPRRGRGEGGVP